MTVMVILLAESIVWLFLLSVAMATKLSLKSGGYEDITLAINKNVPKSVDLVENLQVGYLDLCGLLVSLLHVVLRLFYLNS